LFAGAVLSLLAQSASMNGIALSQLNAGAIRLVLTETQWGYAMAMRIGLSVLAVVLALAWRPSAPVFAGLAILGGLCLASFAFTGHGASDDGAAGMVHVAADMVHSVAAGVWLGALAGFFALSARPAAADELHRTALVKALAGFATTGTMAVATLIITGLVNSYFLIGLAGLPKLLSSAYGGLLVVKLILFAVMLGLAAKNRFRLTPALRDAQDQPSWSTAVTGLRRSLTIETIAGFAILALVAVFGMMEPPNAM